MPIKLQVTKEGTDEPADYLFEQERITIGRGSDNDLTLPDQKVSKKHAEVLNEDGQHILYDRGSKNHTYVRDRELEEEDAHALQSGDVFTVGDFQIEFVPLFMPSSETTAFADIEEDGNPFDQHAAQLANALEGIMQTYTYAPADNRDADLTEAMEGHFDPDTADVEGLQHLFGIMGLLSEDVQVTTPERGDGAPGPAPTPSDGTRDGEVSADVVVDTLLESIARMVSIPTHFWREFSGNTIVHPPERAFLHRADVETLREHLLPDDISEDERDERLRHLREAVNTLVAHNVAMLTGYKKAVMKGSKDLLQEVNPIDAIEEAEDGGMLGSIFGGESGSELQSLQNRWKELFHGEWGKLEKEMYRPTYIEAYLDRMASAWGVDRSEIVEAK